MSRRNFLFALTVIAFISNAIWAQVPEREKVVGGAERAFEKVAKAYVAPGPGCAAAVSLNGEVVFEKAFGSPISSTTFRTLRKRFLSQAQLRSSLPPPRSYSCNRMASSASTIRCGSTFPSSPITVRR